MSLAALYSAEQRLPPQRGGGAGSGHPSWRSPQPLLATGGMLLGYQPEPGRELAPGPKRTRVIDTRGQGGGRDEADAGDRLQTLAHGIGPVPLHQLDLDLPDLLAQA